MLIQEQPVTDHTEAIIMYKDKILQREYSAIKICKLHKLKYHKIKEEKKVRMKKEIMKSKLILKEKNRVF